MGRHLRVEEFSINKTAEETPKIEKDGPICLGGRVAWGVLCANQVQT